MAQLRGQQQSTKRRNTAATGGDSGHCDAQQRVWTAQKNWHDEVDDCGWYCGHWDMDHNVPDPCSDFAAGSFGDCLIDQFGAPGLPGAQGADAVDGAAGYPGMDAETAEAGEQGEPGLDAATYPL